jgi:hypothetical protein
LFLLFSAILRHDASSARRACVFEGCVSRDAESITLLAGSAESIILSAGGAESMMLSACAESMIVSAPPAESMILSAPFDHVTIMLTAARWAATKKKTIGDTNDCRFTTLVKNASMELPIGLPLKMGEFCHTFNRLLVGHQCRCALWQL